MKSFIFLALFAALLNVIACGSIYEIPHEQEEVEAEVEIEVLPDPPSLEDPPKKEEEKPENSAPKDEGSNPKGPKPEDQEPEGLDPEQPTPEKGDANPEKGDKAPEKEDGTVKPEERPEEKPGENSSDDTEEIIFNEMILEKTLVGEVEAGDRIILLLEGIQVAQKFSEIYHRAFSSSWKEIECDISIVERSRGGFSKGGSDDCFLYTQFGSCTMAYRDYAGEVRSPIEFAKDPQSLPLQILIGDKSYSPDRIVQHKKHAVVVTLQVRRAMMEGVTDKRLYLKPIHDTRGEVQTGFLDYVDCPRENRRQFNPGGPTASSMVTKDVKRELQVNLKISKVDP